MIFDIFHSISDPVVEGERMGAAISIARFLRQAVLAEQLGADTIWCAESHFSSEVQKTTSVATIKEFFGEVGLNSDSFQLLHLVASRTRKLNLGTAIHNIVGGSGGPIASADRVNTLRFINEHFWENPRILRIGVASGRFPYQNAPFGIVPRDAGERLLWPCIRRTLFLEALEIFLRLLRGEQLSSADLSQYLITEEEARDALLGQFDKVDKDNPTWRFPYTPAPRWAFETLQLVPAMAPSKRLRIVLGSADPMALTVALRYEDVDLFHLSFTPPERIESLHRQLTAQIPAWHRARLPRTVLVFIDPDRYKARRMADTTLDTYIEAMRGTAMVPDKSVLLQRALVGDAEEIREQLSPDNPRRFQADDRLMLWFEFNQLDGDAIERQMRYFFDQVAGKLA